MVSRSVQKNNLIYLKYIFNLLIFIHIPYCIGVWNFGFCFRILKYRFSVSHRGDLEWWLLCHITFCIALLYLHLLINLPWCIMSPVAIYFILFAMSAPSTNTIAWWINHVGELSLDYVFVWTFWIASVDLMPAEQGMAGCAYCFCFLISYIHNQTYIF